MVRSSPRRRVRPGQEVDLRTAGDLFRPLRCGLGTAFPGIEFTGVQQRSGQFADSRNSQEHPLILVSCSAFPAYFTAGKAVQRAGGSAVAWPGRGRSAVPPGGLPLGREPGGRDFGRGIRSGWIRGGGAGGWLGPLAASRGTESPGRAAAAGRGVPAVRAGAPGRWIRCGPFRAFRRHRQPLAGRLRRGPGSGFLSVTGE